MTLPARATRAIVLVASVLLAGAGRSQTPSPVPPLPTNSPAALAMFAPIGGFPRPGDPGQPPAGCPLLRQSGVFGFTDSMGTPDPNDDREYFLACRSDGIHIIDATPQSGTPAGVQWSASASQVVIPATNHVSFVEETGWGYLGPRPAGAPVTIPENVELGPVLVGAAGDKYFMQMVVEEYSGTTPTGRWAASRGTWFGLAP